MVKTAFAALAIVSVAARRANENGQRLLLTSMIRYWMTLMKKMAMTETIEMV